jgi:hypothetical protein
MITNNKRIKKSINQAGALLPRALFAHGLFLDLDSDRLLHAGGSLRGIFPFAASAAAAGDVRLVSR